MKAINYLRFLVIIALLLSSCNKDQDHRTVWEAHQKQTDRTLSEILLLKVILVDHINSKSRGILISVLTVQPES